ncbi:MAG: hypothetical protein HWE10_04555, partial [Gammaproteobacteria bacterium]|nr:hypothetical protein [Gammaproteobacteria bacterium]
GAYMNTCFSCHALRAPLTDGFEPNQHIMDQFTPSLLAPPLYHADGQIKEEVYVYGSFLQSKMYDEGVTCIDCHDAHSMKVKSQTNGLCLQCHSAQTYQQEQHIRHPLDSAGAQCVNCHMPETTYMGVDARRDHSFRIPRPDLSIKYDTPNACINCHQDQSNTWAANALTQWHGQPEPVDKSQQHFMQLMHNRTLPLEQHLALINDEDMPEIKRASALAMLPYSTNMLTEYVVSKWITSEYPLIRLAVAQVGNLLADEDLLKSYKTLLDDKYKAVRVAAANQMVAIGLEDSSSFNKAFKELLASNENTSWRGEGLFNQSLVDLAAQQEQAAIYKLEQSIKLDPYFVSSYVNLADIYRRLQLLDKEAAVYNKALNKVTKSAELHYAYGMFLIRSNDKPASIEQFKLAMKFDSENPQYAYLYFLALDAVGKTQLALVQLKQVFNKYNKDSNLRNLGLSFAQKLRDRTSFEFFNK